MQVPKIQLRCAPPSGARCGLTLLELMLVLLILALVAGVSLGAFASLDLEERATAGTVRSVFTAAKNAAVARNASSRVRLFPAGTDDTGRALRARLRADAFVVVGTWHFEKRSLVGAFGLEGSETAVGFLDQAYSGAGLAFAQRSGACVAIPVADDPAFDLREGFRIECSLRRDGPGAAPVCALGHQAGIDVSAAGELRGWIQVSTEGDASTGRTAKLAALSEPGVLPMDRWARVALEYDRTHLRLCVDDVIVASLEEDAALAPLDGALTISDSKRVFQGSFDRCVVSALVVGETIELAEHANFVQGTLREVRFDAGGALDRRFHTEPVEVVIDLSRSRQAKVQIGLWGTVEE